MKIRKRFVQGEIIFIHYHSIRENESKTKNDHEIVIDDTLKPEVITLFSAH